MVLGVMSPRDVTEPARGSEGRASGAPGPVGDNLRALFGATGEPSAHCREAGGRGPRARAAVGAAAVTARSVLLGDEQGIRVAWTGWRHPKRRRYQASRRTRSRACRGSLRRAHWSYASQVGSRDGEALGDKMVARGETPRRGIAAYGVIEEFE